MSKTERKALEKAMLLDSFAERQPDGRGCLEIAVAALGGKAPRYLLKHPPAIGGDRSILYGIYGLDEASLAQIEEQLDPEDMVLVFEQPRSLLRWSGVRGNPRAVRGTLITMTNEITQKAHAAAVLPRKRLGKLGQKLRKFNAHWLVDRLHPNCMTAITSTDLAAYLNKYYEDGYDVQFRLVTRAQKIKLAPRHRR